MPKVSVIIPVYNTEKYLKQCLESVINQTLKDIEIICVNDGSTDNSQKILEEYAQKDNRIKLITFPVSCKQGYARNRALDIAQGSYIFFLDSDDLIKDNSLLSLSDRMEKYPCDVVISGIEPFEDDCRPNEYTKKSMKFYSKFYKEEQLYKFCGDFSKEHSGPVAKLYKKSIIDKYNIRFPEFLINEDEAFYWEYFSVIGKVYYINKAFYQRRLHLESTMAKRELYHYRPTDMFYVVKDIYTFFNKNKLYKRYKRQYKKYYFRAKKTILKRCNNTEKNAIIKQMFSFEKKLKIKEYTILQKIFSIRNTSIHKVITICGIKFKIRRRKSAQD